MAKVVALQNVKGGVGKSTMSAHIAAGLATLGYRIGLVDTDSQGHLSDLFGLEKNDALYRVMVEKQPLQDNVVMLPGDRYSTSDFPSLGELYILQGHTLTFDIPLELPPDATFLFLETMREYGRLYNLDYIIVDTSPTLGLFSGSIHLATDGYIYVTECNSLALDGITQAIQQLEGFSELRRTHLNLESHVIGVIPNKLRSQARIHLKNLENLAASFPGIVWSPVMLRVAWEESSQIGHLIYTFKPSGQEARDIWNIVQRTEERLAAWEANAI